MFFMISVLCFVVFAEFLKKNGPRGGVLARFFCPRGRDFALFGPGDGEFAHSKNSPGFCPGVGVGWSGLELTDTLLITEKIVNYFLSQCRIDI